MLWVSLPWSHLTSQLLSDRVSHKELLSILAPLKESRRRKTEQRLLIVPFSLCFFFAFLFKNTKRTSKTLKKRYKIWEKKVGKKTINWLLTILARSAPLKSGLAVASLMEGEYRKEAFWVVKSVVVWSTSIHWIAIWTTGPRIFDWKTVSVRKILASGNCRALRRETLLYDGISMPFVLFLALFCRYLRG